MSNVPARFAALASAGLLAAALSGCGGQSSQAAGGYDDPHPLPQDTMTVVTAEIGRYGGRFVMGQTSSPKTFNALLANETSSSDVYQRLFAAVADFDNATQQTRPILAKSWETSEDGLTTTFHLRRGIRFSDGHPITSEDFLFNFELAYDEELHPSLQDLLKIDGQKFEVSAPDSYTVVVKTPKPYALIVSAVGSLYIMPKHILEPVYRAGNFASAYGTNTPPESLVTSGAWTLKQFVPNEKTVLTRNPYWMGVDAEGNRLPYLDEMVFLIVPDQTAASIKFQAGELDALDNVKAEDYQAYEEGQEAGNYTLYDLGPALNTNFFWFNMNKVREPKAGRKLGDPQVEATKYRWFTTKDFRIAVSKAIDRSAIIRSVYFGDAVNNWSTATAGNKEWHTGQTGYDYDVEGANKLLDGLGWTDKDGDGVREDDRGNPISFTLKTNGDNVMRMSMANFIKDDLAKIGVRCVPSGVDFNTLITNLRQDFNYESILLGLQSGVPPDPGMGQNVWKSSGLTHYWNIKQPKPETAAEARIDELMNLNVTTLDPAVRKQTWAEIERLVLDEAFVFWLPTLVAKVPIRNSFGNLQPSVIPHRIIWNIDRVYQKSRADRT
jgi:peptide/nickel transport system substrate-binding protein